MMAPKIVGWNYVYNEEMFTIDHFFFRVFMKQKAMQTGNRIIWRIDPFFSFALSL